MAPFTKEGKINHGISVPVKATSLWEDVSRSKCSGVGPKNGTH